ncbi:MAG: hypothetical protein ACD_83C00222G0003 [uncultured bacterium]|uniref:Sugar-phosphate isomerase, RpiB/LacA/LacB family n=1 Tax=Berkelbacteria bacterium GW2011_GWA2_38_9 TaxID=1618334 RepID=A0A0G0PKL8_9BACT|nr:MAG: hypothetical protein ACD_83C00222G0003 [uncultured bacterium]KKQ89851.1 MAG: Sugar-phosphate isomerase, RpiB/LacA/LacB family [Berkelbacteria bacterium GW2011_GWA2_38_9]
MIYIGSDHRGFKIKEKIKVLLDKKKLDYKDLGTNSDNAPSDYPDYAQKVGQNISGASDRGILVCYTGTGMCMAANKIKGIRASVVWNVFTAKRSREDNDTNVLCLPAKYITNKNLEKIIDSWLETKFSTEERHIRRLEKINKIESSK